MLGVLQLQLAAGKHAAFGESSGYAPSKLAVPQLNALGRCGWPHWNTLEQRQPAVTAPAVGSNSQQLQGPDKAPELF